MVGQDTSACAPFSIKARKPVLPAILMLSTLLVLSSGLLPAAATAATDTSLSVAERDSAYAAGLSPEATGDRIARQVLSKHPWPTGLIWSVVLEGLMTLSDATGNPGYFDFARENIRAYDDSKKLNTFLSLGYSLYLRTHDPKDMGAFVAQARMDRKNVLRAFDGAVSVYQDSFAVIRQESFERDDAVVMKNDEGGGDIHLRKESTPVWLDHLVIYAARMAKAGWLTGEKDFSRESLDQYLIARAALRDSKTGLWAHGRGWYGDARDVNDVKFGRAQGWLLSSFIDALPYFPPDSNEFRQVHALMLDLANALLRYQDKEGFWHQVADHPESFQETSSTGIIAFNLARAIRHGYLPRHRFEDASRRAFTALRKHRISADGVIHGGSMATAPLKSLQQYMSRPTPVQDPHAIGAILLAAAGQLLLDGRGHLPTEPVPTGQEVTRENGR